jgi:hypothetical protein
VTEIHTLTDPAAYVQKQVERLARRLGDLVADPERVACRHDLDS